MRKIIIVLTAICFTTALAAQSKVNQKAVAQATSEVSTLYKLTSEQQDKMRKIQERRLRNLQEIESLKTSDYKMYLVKRHNVAISTEASLKRMLNEEQLAIHETQVAERRRRESAKLKELKRQGATQEQIEQGLLEIE